MNAKVNHVAENLAGKATLWTGSTTGLMTASLLISLWLISGPLFNFNEVWQLTINTITTIVTFLMVFLIQRTTNKEMMAVHTKLNEIIKAIAEADNDTISIENLSEKELRSLHCKYQDFTRSQETQKAKNHIEASDRLPPHHPL